MGSIYSCALLRETPAAFVALEIFGQGRPTLLHVPQLLTPTPPPSPLTSQLRKRIMQRRQERDKALGIIDEETANKMKEAQKKASEDEKYLPFLIAKKKKKKVNKRALEIEKKAHGRMMLTLANYNHGNRNFLGRMEQQYSVAKTLEKLSKDLGE